MVIQLGFRHSTFLLKADHTNSFPERETLVPMKEVYPFIICLLAKSEAQIKVQCEDRSSTRWFLPISQVRSYTNYSSKGEEDRAGPHGLLLFVCFVLFKVLSKSIYISMDCRRRSIKYVKIAHLSQTFLGRCWQFYIVPYKV